MEYNFNNVARLPAPDDNVGIATQRLESGSEIEFNGSQFLLSHTVLEGHRFAIHSILADDPLLSWGLPFGYASRGINPGDYVCNQKMIDSLSIRNLDFDLPTHPNFLDEIVPYTLDETTFQRGKQLVPHTKIRNFLGYNRPGNRGVGTRNYIVIMGTTARTSGFVRRLADRCESFSNDFSNIDGIVAVTHTEGGEDKTPNNIELLLRTLAGFTIHPNIGAILLVDYGTEAVTNEMLKKYMQRENYELENVVHEFFRIEGGFDKNITRGIGTIKGWLDSVNEVSRSEQSLENLKIALQCGGSDAFSGVSGNPLAAYVAKEVIRYGGCANLAETDELIGAEAYLLQNVRDLATARKFLDTVEEFKERVGWHGHSAEGNPSGGNNYRGLYNIAIKSIGAAMKRNPDVCLDYVISYSELMKETGYYFMDSPGNDLESIAGQVASGSNMIFFVTGNGSITNFPFVPTIKIVTTTDRFEMLQKDMDVNAGAYLDGTPMDVLGEEMLDLTVDVASGELSVGEKAGHSQVSLWRDWKQTGPTDLTPMLASSEVKSGDPISLERDDVWEPIPSEFTFRGYQTADGIRSEQLALILPTSLCSGQIAQMIVGKCNEQRIGKEHGISRFVTLPHTEGCGVSSGRSEEIYTRTMIGHLTHPSVSIGLLLEHGCEKTHNDHVRHEIENLGISPDEYGWASVQMDGGIDSVIDKVKNWFEDELSDKEPIPVVDAGLNHLCIAILSIGEISASISENLMKLILEITRSGGTVVVPSNASFLTETLSLSPSLAYGQSVDKKGFHVMEAPTNQPTEILTGLAATGVELGFVHIVGAPLQSHAMVPLVQVSTDSTTQENYGSDLDLESVKVEKMLGLITEVASREYVPKLHGKGNIDFQLTRGLLGVSM
ncbi:UxaA family hydrolase [Candidatus Poribacteria bacterium]|nr:UxaA family hydrolase [Candidatus Poribacteria bacterium]